MSSLREMEDRQAKEAARASRAALALSSSSQPQADRLDPRITDKIVRDGVRGTQTETVSLAPGSSSFIRSHLVTARNDKMATDMAEAKCQEKAKATPDTQTDASSPTAKLMKPPQQQVASSVRPGAMAASVDSGAAKNAAQSGLCMAPPEADSSSSPIMERSTMGGATSVRHLANDKAELGLAASTVGSITPVTHVDHFYKTGVVPEQAFMKTHDPSSVRGPELETVFYDSGDGSSGLAVAKPVNHEEEDSYIQDAVEYDPDAKPASFYRRRRRYCLYAFVGCFALIAATTGAVVGVLVTGNNNDNFNAAASVPYRETLGIQERVERLIGAEELKDPNSAYSKALQWITHNDTMELIPESPNFVQRYILAYVYYSTTENEPWKSCNPPQEGGDDTCTYAELTHVHPETYKDVPGKGRWLSSLHECSWAALFCGDSEKVVNLWLFGQQLSGPFPSGIKHLSHLQSVTLTWNGLYGTLPADLSVLMKNHLSDIELMYNKFTGTIPEEWWHSDRVVRFNLAENQLNGTIPSQILGMQNLRALYLHDNQLSGQIPSAIGSLLSLSYLQLHGNLLTGPLPDDLTNLVNLDELFLNKNKLSGSLPEDIGRLSLLTDLRLQRNPMLVGDLPDSLYDLKKLQRLDLRWCNFTGSLSPRVAQLENLKVFRLAYNPFLTGPLPAVLQNATDILDIQVQGTSLSGAIAPEICALREKPGLLTTLQADCKAKNETVGPEIECICCTVCCDEDGLSCSAPES